MKTLFNISRIAALSLLMFSCTSTKTFVDNLSGDKPDYSQLYLRGSFTWWEADEAYRVTEVQEHVYRVIVDLVADGQPYDFKFADKDWTSGLSCGYKNKNSDENLKVNLTVNANCDTPVDNFVFTPEESGKYIFQIDFNSWLDPKVTVLKL